jgi:putative spermidine/putrescine transport system substrate-binding protein
MIESSPMRRPSAMRALLLLGLLLAPVVASAQAPAEPKLEDRVVVGIYGGLLGQRLRAAIDGYTKPLGVEAVYVEGTSNDLLAKARAQKSNPQMDLFVGNDQTFALAKSLELLEKINPALVPTIAKMRPEFRDPDGYGQFYEINPVGLVYRTDKLAEAGIGKPRSWQVYADPAIRGRAILFPPTVSYGFHFLIGLAMSAGKDEHDITPAWTAMERVRANEPLIQQTPGQAEAMTGRGEAWIYVSSAERANLLAKQGSPIGFAVPQEGVIVLPNFMAPVRNAKHPIAAQRVLNHMLDKSAQTQMTREGAVAAVNTDVELTPELKVRMGFAADQPLPAFHVLDVGAINKQLDGWVERFNRTVSR